MLSYAIPDSIIILDASFEPLQTKEDRVRRRKLISDILNANISEVLEERHIRTSQSLHSEICNHDAWVSTKNIERRNTITIKKLEDVVMASSKIGIYFHENDGGAWGRKLFEVEIEEKRLQVQHILNV